MFRINRGTARLGVVLGAAGLATAALTGVAAAAPGAAPQSSLHPCTFDGGDVSGECTVTLTNLNERLDPTSNSTSEGVVPQGAQVILFCWSAGQSVNGDNIWYDGQPTPPNEEIFGFYMSGFWLDTGHDPASSIPQC